MGNCCGSPSYYDDGLPSQTLPQNRAYATGPGRTLGGSSAADDPRAAAAIAAQVSILQN